MKTDLSYLRILAAGANALDQSTEEGPSTQSERTVHSLGFSEEPVDPAPVEAEVGKAVWVVDARVERKRRALDQVWRGVGLGASEAKICPGVGSSPGTDGR